MIACRSCKSENSPDRRYCGQCGTSMRWSCGGCKFDNSASDRFCGGCGQQPAVATPVAPPAPAVAATIAAVAKAPMIGDLLSFTDIRSLVNKVQPQKEELPAKVTQEDLDRLFGDLA